MEKIYVEENQKKNKNTRLTVSVGLSFAVAFAAIVSILFVSMSGTTYSLDDVTTLPTTITTNEPGAQIQAGENFVVKEYSAQGVTNPIYCVESAKGFEYPQTLSRVKKSGGGEYVIEDVGFIYLLTKLANLSVDASDINSTVDISNDKKARYVEAWLNQTAIWSYLGRIGAENSKEDYSAANAAALYAVDSLNVSDAADNITTTLTTTDSTKSFYELVGLKTIVDAAYTYHPKTTYLNVGLTKASDKFTVTKGYLKSDRINVKYDNTGVISDQSDTYSLTLSNAPKGTKVYGINSSGKEELIKDLKNVSYSKYKSLYLYVPTSEVKGTVKFSVGITGKFEVYTGYYYENGTAQRVTTVDKVAMSRNAGEDFTITKAPDTASNASRIMYIVGMVVLLSGLGILYVNIKNQKQYQ